MNLLKHYIIQTDYVCFILSVAILPLSIKLSSKLLFLAIVIGLIKKIYSKDFSWFSTQKPITFFIAIFVAYIIIQGLVLDAFNVFLKTFERAYAPYLIFLLVPLFYAKEEIVRQIPMALTIGVFMLFSLMLIGSLIDLQWYNREKVLEVFDIHHSYISLYILFIINFLICEASKFKLISKIILIFVLILFLVLFKSKSALAVVAFLILYHTLVKLKLDFIKVLCLVVSGILLIFLFNTFFYQIYLEALDFRSRIWEAAITVIADNPIFGYGSLNEYKILNFRHFLDGNYDFLDSNLNAHNQFLSFTIKFGVIGLTLMLLSFSYPLFKMHSSLKKEYMGFLIIMFFMCCIESFFNRHHGIVFFCIMLFYYNTLGNKVK